MEKLQNNDNQSVSKASFKFVVKDTAGDQERRDSARRTGSASQRSSKMNLSADHFATKQTPASIQMSIPSPTPSSKVKPGSPKKSLFRIVADEKGMKNFFVMNENSLPALIFSEMDVMYDYSRSSEDVMYERLVQRNPHMTMLSNLLTSKAGFMRAIYQMSENNIGSLFDSLRILFLEIIELIRGARRIKSIFDTAPQIRSSMSIEDAMKQVVDFICECLKCERATVFAVDRLNNEIWSKVAKGATQTIKIPIGKGVAGYVAKTGNPLNIRDAYQDDRFDPSYDKKTGFKTNSILAVPVWNSKGEVEGVVQAINKVSSNPDETVCFDRNDQGLLEMISNLAGNNIQNTIEYNQQLAIMNNFRNILKVGVRLFSIRDEKTLIWQGIDILKDIFVAQKASIYIVNLEDDSLIYTYDDNGLKRQFKQIGILGDAIQKRQIVSVTDSKADPRYNGLIDIDTTLTLLSVPLVEPMTNITYGCFQVIYPRASDGITCVKSRLLHYKESST